MGIACETPRAFAATLEEVAWAPRAPALTLRQLQARRRHMRRVALPRRREHDLAQYLGKIAEVLAQKSADAYEVASQALARADELQRDADRAALAAVQATTAAPTCFYSHAP